MVLAPFAVARSPLVELRDKSAMARSLTFG
jgi:hypothetical protein